jgi:hypothetical protein
MMNLLGTVGAPPTNLEPWGSAAKGAIGYVHADGWQQPPGEAGTPQVERVPTRSASPRLRPTRPEPRVPSWMRRIGDRHGAGPDFRDHPPASLGELAMSTAARWGQCPTPTALWNEAQRLPGRELCARESHARSCRSQLETNSWPSTLPAASLTDYPLPADSGRYSVRLVARDWTREVEIPVVGLRHPRRICTARGCIL